MNVWQTGSKLEARVRTWLDAAQQQGPAELARWRQKYQLTREAAAALLGVSHSYLILVEGGKRRVTLQLAARLARVTAELNKGGACSTKK